jgi:FkbM family methyltransferase
MLKAMIQSSPFYPAVRSIYRAVFKPEQVAATARMGAFYAQFFQPGEVVFDVGANQGEYAECFAREGGRVIAIEPNVAHRTRLEALAKFLPITPAYVAISDRPGVATLNISSTSGYSTLADTNSAWMAESPDYATAEWIGSAEVRTVTLDDVAAQYGQASFVKIDIEGHELAALRGMSFRPRYLSFEYSVHRKELGLACIEHLNARGYRFRPIDGRDFRFSNPDWMLGEEASAWLRARTIAKGEYGDLFACRWP